MERPRSDEFKTIFDARLLAARGRVTEKDALSFVNGSQYGTLDSLFNEIAPGVNIFGSDERRALLLSADYSARTLASVRRKLEHLEEGIEVVAILDQSDPRLILDYADHAFLWMERSIGGVFVGMRSHENNIQRLLLRSFFDRSKGISSESELSALADGFAKKASIVTDKRKLSVIGDVLTILGIDNLNQDDILHFRKDLEHRLSVLNEGQIALSLLLLDRMVEFGVLSPQTWFRMARTPDLNTLRSGHLSLMHDRLVGDSRGGTPPRYWPARSDHGDYFLNATNILRTFITRHAALNPGTIAESIHNAMREATPGNYELPLPSLVGIANRVITIMNNNGGVTMADGQRTMVDQLDPQSLGSVADIGWVFLRACYGRRAAEEGDDYIRDSLIVDIAGEFARRVAASKGAQRVITIGELALKHPKATGAQLRDIVTALQSGSGEKFDLGQERLREIVQASGQRTALWKARVRGYGYSS